MQQTLLGNAMQVKKKPEKVIITITDYNHRGERNRFDESVEKVGGQEYTSVSFRTNRYGSSSPCSNQAEIDHSISHMKNWIIREGDIPIVEDLRKSQSIRR